MGQRVIGGSGCGIEAVDSQWAVRGLVEETLYTLSICPFARP